MIKKIKNNLIYFEFSLFQKHSNIKHFISTRINDHSNNFNLSLYSPNNKQIVIKNRQKLAQTFSINKKNFVFQQQVHGNKVSVINESSKGKGFYTYTDAIPANDAMITDKKNICLSLMAGDCVPILFFDPQKMIIAVAHSGWRGTYKRIAEATLKKMQQHFSSDISDILIGIGPSIGYKHYEVDEIVYNQFKKNYGQIDNFFKPKAEKDKYLLNLWQANFQQLLECGIKAKNIEISKICTYEQNDLFFSARKGDSGRFAAGIMLTKWYAL